MVRREQIKFVLMVPVAALRGLLLVLTICSLAVVNSTIILGWCAALRGLTVASTGACFSVTCTGWQ
jgi:hypothetical protein